jgi:hypothetical protein
MNNEVESTYKKVVMNRNYVFLRILLQPCYLMSSRVWEPRSIGANIGIDFGPLFCKGVHYTILAIHRSVMRLPNTRGAAVVSDICNCVSRM